MILSRFVMPNLFRHPFYDESPK